MRQPPVEVEQHAEAEHGREDAADELHQAGADEIADAVGVAHDARQQHAGLRRIEVAHRQAHDVRLHALAHLGDRALRGDAENLRVDERRDRLNGRGDAAGERDRQQQIVAPLADAPRRRGTSTTAGSTRPARRLISISTRPSSSRLAVRHSSSRASRHAADGRHLLLAAGGVVGRSRRGAARGAPARSARRHARGRDRSAAVATSVQRVGNGERERRDLAPRTSRRRAAPSCNCRASCRRWSSAGRSSCTRSSCPARAPAARRRRPAPRTSCTSPSASVMIQWRLTSCAVSSPTFEIVIV